MPDLRTSTMTHIVWCPPEWRAKARATLAGLLERHPARTIFLIPCPGSEAKIEHARGAEGLPAPGCLARGALGGDRAPPAGLGRHHPGSIVLPLLVSDLPVFCRWRGEPELGERAARRDRRRHRPPRRRLVGVARCPAGLRLPRGAVRQRRRLGHRVLAHAALAAPARRPLARDRDREAPGRGPARRRGARRRLAPLAAEARRRADAAGRSRGEGDVGRRRARRFTGRAANGSELSRPSSISSAATAVYEAAVRAVVAAES